MKRKQLVKIFVVLIFFLSAILFAIHNRDVEINSVFPEKPWAVVYRGVKEVKGIGEPIAKNCGKCHNEIYEEWNTSTHSRAYTDLQFQSELNKETSPKWLCLNCHIPFENQRENLVTKLKGGDYRNPVLQENSLYKAGMEEEGVSCATCHVRVTDTGEGYILGANGTTNPPHPVRIEKNELRSICLNCHQADYRLSDQLVCAFETGNEMKVWQKLNPENKEKDCVSCHLPEAKRSFVVKSLNKSPKVSHIHGFMGGGVPKEFSLYEHQVPKGYKRGFDVSNFNFKNGIFHFSLMNIHAGHSIPSGDPERFLLLEYKWLDSERNIQSKHSEEIGQKWSWNPKAKKESDNRLLPGEVREITIKSPETTGIKYLTIEIYHVRLREEIMEYMKKSSKSLDNDLKGKIQYIEHLYPGKTLVYQLEYDLQTKNFLEKSPFQK